jgi:hypothetical protein
VERQRRRDAPPLPVFSDRGLNVGVAPVKVRDLVLILHQAPSSLDAPRGSRISVASGALSDDMGIESHFNDIARR